MTGRNYGSPLALERAIMDRIAARAEAVAEAVVDPGLRARTRSEEIQRRRREVAYRRLLARLFHAGPDAWVVKGGVALQFRLDPSRASLDVDVSRRGRISHAEAVEDLRRAAALDLGDFFVFEVGAAQIGADADRALELPVTARLGTKVFEKFSVDMPPPRIDVPGEPASPGPSVTGIGLIDDVPGLMLLPIVQQIAEKTCAMFETRGVPAEAFSSRSRDLADLALIATQIGPIEGDELLPALEAEAERRPVTLPQGLPRSFELPPAQVAAWRRTWPTGIRRPPVSIDQALATVAPFLGPVFGRGVAGRRWASDRGVWAPISRA